MAYEQLKLENQLCFRLYTVSRLITQCYQPWLSKMNLTYTQYIVLMVLWEKDSQPVNDIAKRLYLETNTVTPLIKRLEAAGIVTRKKDQADARKTIVSLTAKGHRMEKEAAEIPGCMTDVLLNTGLKTETLIQMAEPLDNIISHMTQCQCTQGCDTTQTAD